MVTPLQEPYLDCSYNAETRLVKITYGKFLSPQITQAAYGWIGSSMDLLEVAQVYGCVFDFTAVEVFGSMNLSTARQEHSALHEARAAKTQRIPAALLVLTRYQETFVKTSMRVTNVISDDAYPRVLLVRAMADALQHFVRWHEEYDEPENTGLNPTLA